MRLCLVSSLIIWRLVEYFYVCDEVNLQVLDLDTMYPRNMKEIHKVGEYLPGFIQEFVLTFARQ